MGIEGVGPGDQNNQEIEVHLKPKAAEASQAGPVDQAEPVEPYRLEANFEVERTARDLVGEVARLLNDHPPQPDRRFPTSVWDELLEITANNPTARSVALGMLYSRPDVTDEEKVPIFRSMMDHLEAAEGN